MDVNPQMTYGKYGRTVDLMENMDTDAQLMTENMDVDAQLT